MNSFDTVEGKDWLKSLLLERVVKVTFTKKDGSERVLTCTLNSALIPQKVTESEVVEGKPERAKSTESLAVYDVELDGWRSFRWDSIRLVDFVLA
jgi:hypothetical protein